MNVEREICLVDWVPDVTDTEILSADFAAVHINDPDWYRLLKTALEHSFSVFSGSGRDKLKRTELVIKRTIIPGDTESDVYMHVEKMGGSIRRENPSDALELTYRIAYELQCPLEVVLVLKGKTTRLWFDIPRIESELLAQSMPRPTRRLASVQWS
jgi:hypothetical protein